MRRAHSDPGSMYHISFIRRITSALALAAVVSAVFPLHASAQSTGSLTGRVLATDGSPIVGAFVSVDDHPPAAQSAVDGSFRVDSVSIGGHVVHTRRSGYIESVDSVTVRASTAVEVTVSLALKVATLTGVTVIGTRTDQAERREALARIPGGVAIVGTPQIRATRQANLKDVLQFVPGVYIQPRFGAADESQISIRGSGLRNNFHARGINLLVNGMPYRNADGFTDFESLELLTTEDVQVYKGANALRYGGSTLGGAVNLETQTGYTAAPFNAVAEGGSSGFFKGQASSGAVLGRFNYYASYAATRLDGYRDHDAQRRDRVNLHLGYALSPRVDLRTFYLFAHVREELPGSLTAAEFAADPTLAVAGNVANGWGRDYDLHHLGVQLRAQLGRESRLDVAPYFQYREIGPPIFRVIDQVSRDWGVEARFENTTPLGGRENRLTLGVQPTYGNVDDKQFVNAAGDEGALAKDQRDVAGGVAVYVEDALHLAPRLTSVVGLRYARGVRGGGRGPPCRRWGGSSSRPRAAPRSRRCCWS